jgi:uncharacterized protein YerC
LKLSRKQVEALLHLRNLPEFQEFLGILNTRAEILDRKLVMKDDVKVDLVRGELRAYVQIQDDLRDAPNTLARLERGYEEYADGTP